MLENRLIFSEERGFRILRHLLFWFIFWIYFGALHAAAPFGKPEIAYFQNLPFTYTESLLMLVPQMVITYPVLYFILPRFFLKKKYFSGFILFALLTIVGAIVSQIMIAYVNPIVTRSILPEEFLRNTERPAAVEFFMGLMLSFKGGLFCMALAVGLSLMKHWFLKEYRNVQLHKEKTDAQLQLLNAQIHPHFLFNTLNNIYSQTQLESPKGSKMIMDLADMLRYVLYEGQRLLVPLSHELQMIRQYIGLEKVRYGNKLDVHIVIPEGLEEIFIAPLLLLPFIENCFKHGTSNILLNPWVNLTVEMHDETTLSMKLINGKAANKSASMNSEGIGINNVRKRLELLYAGKHELQIIEEDEVFVVDLRVELIKKAKEKIADEQNLPEVTTVYA